MIRRRTVKYDTKTGHERWLVSYADFITLLFGFFVVMYSVSQVNESKYRTLAETLSETFVGPMKLAGVPAPERTDQPRGASPGTVANLIDTQLLARNMSESLAGLVRLDHVNVTATEAWMQIDINANLLFDSASAEPGDDAKAIFRDIAAELAPYANEIEVAGHTDDIPINTARFQSNWELSSARAAAVVKLLAAHGVDPTRMSAVGYGEFRPVDDNSSATGRAANRRVVLMVARTAVERPVVVQQAMQNNLPQPQPAEARPREADPSAPPIAPPIPAPLRLDSGGLLFTNGERDAENQ